MIIYYKFYSSYDKYIVWASDFVLPSSSVGVEKTIEPLKEDKKLAGRSVVLVKRDEVWNSVST